MGKILWQCPVKIHSILDYNFYLGLGKRCNSQRKVQWRTCYRDNLCIIQHLSEASSRGSSTLSARRIQERDMPTDFRPSSSHGWAGNRRNTPSNKSLCANCQPAWLRSTKAGPFKAKLQLYARCLWASQHWWFWGVYTPLANVFHCCIIHAFFSRG